MAIRNLARESSRPGGHKGSAKAAPIYVDTDTSTIKYIPGGEGSTTEIEVIDATATQTISGTKTFSGTVTTGLELTRGAGVDTAESYETSVVREGGLIITKIVLDLSTLVGSATDTDIIGETGGAASCHWGQITTAINGTMIGGRVTCLEVPAGGTADINFYSAVESTGAQDALATSLDEVVLVDSGGAWTSGATKGMTALPRANDYIYIANGAAAGGTFSAGKFEIVLFGSA